MDIRNNREPAKKRLPSRIVRIIGEHFDNLVKSSEIKNGKLLISSQIKKDAELREQVLNNQAILEEKQKLLMQANSDLPIFFESYEQLIILEALLLARARDGKPVADIIAAIETIKADDNNSMPKSSPEKNETLITHKYQIPVLSEIGDIIYIAGKLILFTPMVVYLYFAAMFLTNPSRCETQVTIHGEFENRSSYCQIVMQFNRFFSDYQKVDESKK